jgi:hypothetical protein
LLVSQARLTEGTRCGIRFPLRTLNGSWGRVRVLILTQDHDVVRNEEA